MERLPLPGSVAARPGARASVTPPLAGRLLPPRGGSLPTIGDRVEAGQTVARIEPPLSDLTVRIIDADAATTRARIALEQAEALLDRTRRLAQESARSPRELEDAEFAARRARAEHEAASTIQASYEKTGLVLDPQADGGASPSVELRAPISGAVVRVAAAMGEHVLPERSLFEILDATRVVVEARVPEADAGRLAPALAASYEVPGAPGSRVPIIPGGSGRLLQVGLEVDPATRTVPIIYEVDNPGGALRIGQAVVVHLETRHVQEGIAIPWSAIVDEDVRSVVFVEVSGESFEKREVTLGVRDGDRVEVLSGVAEGERVVSRGAYAVRLASVSSSIPAHGHAH